MELVMSAGFRLEGSQPCGLSSTTLEELPQGESDPIIIASSQPLSTLSHPDLSLLTDQYYVSCFLPRSSHQVRQTYFQKLMRNGMLPESPRQKCHHVVIFDWDDTLLCTSHLTAHKITELDQMSTLDLQRLAQTDASSGLALRTALEWANVYIVTNSVTGWVHYSAKKFMPLTHQILVDNKIQVVSARSKYAQTFPGDGRQWKTEAFKELLVNLSQRQTVLNLLVVGDSRHEMEAAESVSQMFDRRFSKTIKLRERPRLQELNKELQLVCGKLGEVIRLPKSLTIRLQSKRLA